MPDWSELITHSKVGNCSGCKLYATLHQVYVGGGSRWLCANCIAKVKKVKGSVIYTKLRSR